jgi:hypothetical protein
MHYVYLYAKNALCIEGGYAMNKSTVKSLSLLLCLVLVLGLLPVGALATEAQLTQDGATPDEASSLTVYVNGVDVKDIDAQDDTLSWDAATNTLTLNNASILNANGNYKGSGIYAVGSDTLVLELVGDNTVEGKYNGDGVDDIFANAAISTVGDLVIRGEGSLTATNLRVEETRYVRSAGIYSGGELTIEGGNITATTQFEYSARYVGSVGILSGDFDSIGVMTVSGGTVVASGPNAGICSVGNMTVSGGSITSTGTAEEYSLAIDLFQTYDTSYIPELNVSGGKLELQGTEHAVNGYIQTGGDDNHMWTDTKGGMFRYSTIHSFAGMMTDYLLITPSNYRLAQPTAENGYTAGLETLVDGEFTTVLPEGVTAEYQWYTQTSRHVTAQDVVYTADCTYDDTTGLWNFAEYCSLVFAAQPGDAITITLDEASTGLFLAASGSENIFDAIADGVYTLTVADTDVDPDTGLFVMQTISQYPFQGTISVGAVQEIPTAADDDNRFSYDTAGTYCGQITFAENGTVLGTLRTDAFDYLPVNFVTFEAEEGSYPIDVMQTQEGLHTLGKLPKVTRTGYSLLGWFDTEGNEITADTVILEDIVVCARWEINSYTLTVQGVDGLIFETPVVYGSELDAIISGLEIGEVVTAEGTYTFNGNYDISVPATMPATDLVLTAQYDFTPKPKGELVSENGGLYYYEDGKLTYAGLIELDGNYYYIRTNGQAVTGRTYWTTKTNGLLKADNYYFDETGKLCKKNGLVSENGGLYYYVEGKLNYA